MGFADYLTSSCIALDQRISSKKKVLECLVNMLCDEHRCLDKDILFKKLIEREHLGSTAMGKGIAIPHCRITDLEQPVVGLLGLADGVDYDAPDEISVRLFLALVVPEEANQHHLNLLADIARKMNNDTISHPLLNMTDAPSVLKLLRNGDENF